MPTGSEPLPPRGALGPTSHQSAIATSRSASARISTVPATWSSGSSTRSNSVGGSRRATTSSRPTTSRSSSLHQYRLWLRVNEYTASTSAICGTFWERASASPVRPQWLRQKKTGQPVKFELTEQTRQAIDDYVKAGRRKPGEFLFTSRANRDRCISTRQYARLVSEWIASIGLDAKRFGTHSLRRTKATLIYRRTGTFGPSGFCSAIPRSRARSGISASRR